jgi:Flp pilus assembly protein TadG
MTEFAVVLPILAFVLFAIMQFGITFNNYLSLTDAVRAGARTAAVSRTASNPTQTTIDKVKAASADLNTANETVTVTASSGWVAGQDVTVTATYPFSISLFGLVIKSGNLSSSTTERIE